MSSGMEPHSPRSRARRHFLGVAAAAGGRVAAATAGLMALSSLPARAFGDKWWHHDKDRDDDDDARCFLRGTAIMTPDGEVRIEDLKIGDRVETVAGRAMAVKWIGRRLYRRSGPSFQAGVMPVRIARHALDARTPHRDLYLSPNHALYLDGVLIRVKELVNGISIVPALPIEQETVEYFNIALDSHEVILAEGAPAETFLLRANSHENFANFAEFERLRSAGSRQPVTPYAPVVGYEGGREHLTALISLAAPRFLGLRDPVQNAYERIAARA
jgi:hypothetical protein